MNTLEYKQKIFYIKYQLNTGRHIYDYNMIPKNNITLKVVNNNSFITNTNLGYKGNITRIANELVHNISYYEYLIHTKTPFLITKDNLYLLSYDDLLLYNEVLLNSYSYLNDKLNFNTL
jgi:hypothetical protein